MSNNATNDEQNVENDADEAVADTLPDQEPAVPLPGQLPDGDEESPSQRVPSKDTNGKATAVLPIPCRSEGELSEGASKNKEESSSSSAAPVAPPVAAAPHEQAAPSHTDNAATATACSSDIPPGTPILEEKPPQVQFLDESAAATAAAAAGAKVASSAPGADVQGVAPAEGNRKVRFPANLTITVTKEPLTLVTEDKITSAENSPDTARSSVSRPQFFVINDGGGSPKVHRTSTGSAVVACSPKAVQATNSKSLRTPGRLDLTTNSTGSNRFLRDEASVSIAQSSGRKLEDEYRLITELGKGSFGHVFKAVRLSDNLEVAVKTINSEDDDEYLQHEMDITKRMNHPNICWLHSIIRNAQQVHLVMELCTGGDLFDKIANGRFFSETMIIVYLWQMVAGIAYCHNFNFCHRDVKPENYLLASPAGDAPLKLIDFGLARRFETGTPMTSAVGSIYYISPEVINGRYSEKRDIWSIGIVGYMMCTMRVPYAGETEEELSKEICSCSLDMARLDSRFLNNHPIKALLHRMLVPEAKRPSAKELTNDEWFRTKGTQDLRARRCCLPCFF